ncbi:ASCH/PUA domain-containing protein [Aeromonas veronii]|uniref:ASCH/PUA domain-containing protein n=1 Tax=Aeromonas veronii TaxID=654 RepID=UPI001959FC1B|nr:ASCH/PUA domain-containing protein [Aeromonas veronii]
MKHELKIKPEYFAAVVNGEKTFEIRNNDDRNFQVGDTLVLKSFDGEFNGNFVERTVSYITDFEQKPGYVVLGIVGAREFELLERLTSIGIAIDKAAMSGKVPDQHPMKNRLEMLAKRHQKMLLIESLNDDLLDLVERMVKYMVLAGEEPEKDSCNPIKAWMYDAITTMAGQRPKQSVTITETIRTAPERIWLQVGDQSHYHSEPFPEHHDEVCWCADSVVACEVPYVRADLDGQRPAHAVQDALVALSDIASLQRYTLGGNCDSFGQDCGAEMEQDDEGEYIMLAEALALSPSK